MPILVDPDKVLPDHSKKVSASQVISFLLYPVIFVLGVVVGVAIGVKEAPSFTKNTNGNTNRVYGNSSIVQNINSGNKNSNANLNKNSNANIPSYLNTNILHAGDYAKLDAKTEAGLQAEKQADLDSLVDKTADTTDILRQQDLISLKYNLLTYHAVRGDFPSTDGVQIKLERDGKDAFYVAMKDFYGGSFYERVDPQSPQYYYGYTSDGQSFTLSAYLVSKSKIYYISSND